MTDTHWQPPQSGNSPPTAPGWTPGGPGYQPGGPALPPKRPRMALIVGLTAVVCALLGAAAGSVTGVLVTRGDNPAAAPPAPPPAPTAEEVRAQTESLCTRFASAYAALPDSNQTGLEVLPVVSYIENAMGDTPGARADIRDAVNEWLQQAYDWVAVLGNEAPNGFIKLPTNWTGAAANDASRRVFMYCRTG